MARYLIVAMMLALGSLCVSGDAVAGPNAAQEKLEYDR